MNQAMTPTISETEKDITTLKEWKEFEFLLDNCSRFADTGIVVKSDKERLAAFLVALIQSREEAVRRETAEMAFKELDEIAYQNALKKKGAVITNARNGSYELDSHQIRMSELIDKAKAKFHQIINQKEDK